MLRTTITRATVAFGLAAACLVATTAPVGAQSRTEASDALGRGDGVTAAQIIRSRGWSTNPEVLADLIYDAGALAVDRGLGDDFAAALPVAYLRGAVPYEVANNSFRVAAITVLQRGVTPEQGRVGALAVMRTNAAYLGFYFPQTAGSGRGQAR